MFCAATAIFCAATAAFEQKTIAVDGDVIEVIAADLDGDNKKDLLVPYKRGVEPRETRHLSIFWNRSGRFYERPDETFDIPAETTAIEVADADGVAGDELLLINPQGLLSRNFAGRKVGEPRTLIEEPTLFSQADAGALPRLHIAQSLDENTQLFLHAPRALHIYRRTETGYERAATLAVKLDSDIDKQRRGRADRRNKNIPPVSLTVRFPAITVIDTNSDGLRDVVLTLDDRIAIYRQREGLQFAAQPTFTRDFAVRTVEDRKESYSWVGLSVLELDGDGAADIVVRKNVAKGIASASASNYLYLGKKSGYYVDKPDQTLSTEGAGGAEVELFDITGDGHADLIVPSVDIGIMTIIRYLTSSSFQVETSVFSFDTTKRRFTEKPVAQREMEFDISLKGEADSEAFDMIGDYDGDKRPDLVFATGENELSIFRGLGQGSLFSDDATEKITVRSYGQLLSVDIDGRGRSDMVLYYPRTNGHRSEVVVLKNLSGQ